MDNSIKIIAALKQAFPGHKVEISRNFNAKIYWVFIDDNYVGNFEDRFIEQDFDNPEIEIKVKAPIKKITTFVNNCNIYREDIHEAVKRGLKEWEEESQHKAEGEDATILDKIRADIESQREEISKRCSGDIGLLNYYFGRNDGLKDARYILDKYRQEVRIRNERTYT